MLYFIFKKIKSEKANKPLNENPLVKRRHEFIFQELSNKKRGVFIIEFIGNGFSSRAVIKKGAL